MEKENNILLLLSGILIISAVSISCNSGNIFSASETIDGHTWSASEVITFRAPVNNTMKACDINLVIRTDKSYPYRNLFLFITTTAPAGLNIKDTVEYFLADEKGNWYGSGLGDINDLSVPFKTNIFFPDTGIYTFRIQHGMRDQRLDGVADIGIHIRERKQ
ncbi:MAG: gliding motility lipoprotein GldH [Bacteroidales bacterium]|nr:gliding motility lipoprotein GldH [Bacteroidales bacterium]